MLNWDELIEGIFLVKEKSTRVNRLNSLVIKDNREKFPILIDANYPFEAIDELYSRIKGAKKLIFSHGHLDHTGHAFYHQEKYKTSLVCPVQEVDYLTDLDSLMERVGFSKLKLSQTYLMMVKEYMKFQECVNVNTFRPGKDFFDLKSFRIETIHIPGHSPGHTAFRVSPKEKSSRKVLFVADIGSHPYYGDFNSNINQYRNSIDKLEETYLNDDYILVPAHGHHYIESEPEFFDRIRGKISKNKKSVMESLSRTESISLRHLVEKRIITPEKRIFEPIKDLYYLWDGGIIYQHLQELMNEDQVREISYNGFLSNEYLLN